MWRYYLIGGTEVLFRTDNRRDAYEKARELAYSRGVGASPVVVVRALFRNQLTVERRDDI